MKKQAFTLIELLVVVLIIGILAAIAVPQYKLAVDKARAAEAISILKNITEAQEVYYLANGEYTDDLENLDIKINLDGNYFTFACQGKRTCKASPKLNAYPLFEFHLQNCDVNSYYWKHRGKRWCVVERLINNGAPEKDIQYARNICKMFGNLDEEMEGEHHYLISF